MEKIFCGGFYIPDNLMEIRDGKKYLNVGGGGGGGTTDHRDLTNRDAANQHPIEAIDGLQDALDGKQNAISDLATIRSGASKGATAVQPSAIADMAKKSETNAALATKADKADTYTKSEVYNKAEVDAKVSALEDADDDLEERVQAIEDDYLTSESILNANKLDGNTAITNGVTATTQNANDNSDKVATTKYVTNAISALGSVLTFKGVKATLADIEAVVNPKEGDVYNCQADGVQYVYINNGWNALGSTVDISNLVSKDDVVQTTGNSTSSIMSQAAVTNKLNDKEDVTNKVTIISASSTNTQYPTAKAVYDELADKEDADNKVTSINSTSTDVQYPSAKCVYNELTKKEDVDNKVTSISSSSTDVQYPSAKAVYTELEEKEDVDNKVTALSGASTNDEYPSAKCVYDALAGKQDVIDDLDDIRDGAELGATSVQPADIEDMATKTYVAGYHDATKQDKLIAGENIAIVGNVISAVGGGEGGTTNHALLSNRDAANQHPISAISGLQTALDGKQPVGDYALKSEIPDVDDFATKTYVDTSVATKQDKIDDLATIRSGAALGATALQEVPDTYATKTYVDNHHDVTKQDVISDLSDIREGAELGATAVQPNAIADMATKTYVDNHHDATKQDVISDLATIRSGASKGATSVQPADIADMETKTEANAALALKADKSNTYTKSEVYNKTEIDGKVSALEDADSDLEARVQAIEDDYLTSQSTLKANKLDGNTAITDGVTATTQDANDNSDKIATTKYVTTAISALGSVLSFKGVKATFADIEAVVDPKEGDVYNCQADGVQYVYIDGGWNALGSTVDVSNFVSKDDIKQGTGNGTSVIMSQAAVTAELNDKEDVNNKVTTISASSTNDQYPSAKAVYDALGDKQGAISDLETIRAGAAKGATALQEVPDEYITETELNAYHDATKQDKLTAGDNIDITSNVVSAVGLEKVENKVTTLDENSTDTQYPSAKAVYDGLETKKDDFEVLQMAEGGTGSSTIKNAPNNAIIKKLADSNQLWYTPTNKGAFYATSENGTPNFGTLPLNCGGTGTGVDLNNAPANAIIKKYAGGNQLLYTATNNGAMYATEENGAPKFGTLPVAQGGTGYTYSRSIVSLTKQNTTKFDNHEETTRFYPYNDMITIDGNVRCVHGQSITNSYYYTLSGGKQLYGHRIFKISDEKYYPSVLVPLSAYIWTSDAAIAVQAFVYTDGYVYIRPNITINDPTTSTEYKWIYFRGSWRTQLQ